MSRWPTAKVKYGVAIANVRAQYYVAIANAKSQVLTTLVAQLESEKSSL